MCTLRQTSQLLMFPLLLAACQEPLRPAETAPAFAVFADARQPLVVMTRNLYIGVELGRIAGPFNLVPFQVADAFARVQQSNFTERAQTIADEIAKVQPHLLGLQEVSLIRIQTPGDAIVGGTTPAMSVYADYLEILLQALAQRGLSYYVAAVTQDFDIEAPMVTSPAPTFSDVRLTDREVILARSDVQVSNPQERNYTAASLFLGAIPLTRGWASVDATVGGRTFRFVATHLQPDDLPGAGSVQVAQAAELLAEQANALVPIVLAGDFNSAANGSTTSTYGMITAAGYGDAWLASRKGAPGYTCCQTEDLKNRASQLDTRIDLILFSGTISALGASLIGHVPAARTSSGLWPSDHAGVYAGLRLE